MQSLDPAILEIEVSAPLSIEPDGAYLLEGATAQFKITEKGVDAEGKETVSIGLENKDNVPSILDVIRIHFNSKMTFREVYHSSGTLKS